jgi:hypothetical protein
MKLEKIRLKFFVKFFLMKSRYKKNSNFSHIPDTHKFPSRLKNFFLNMITFLSKSFHSGIF